MAVSARRRPKWPAGAGHMKPEIEAMTKAGSVNPDEVLW
jgi:hypothetical protein